MATSDELGFDVAENRVHVHDLHATILHLLGLDHTRLTHRFQGRDFRLTDVQGAVVREILAPSRKQKIPKVVRWLRAADLAA